MNDFSSLLRLHSQTNAEEKNWEDLWRRFDTGHGYIESTGQLVQRQSPLYTDNTRASRPRSYSEITMDDAVQETPMPADIFQGSYSIPWMFGSPTFQEPLDWTGMQPTLFKQNQSEPLVTSEVIEDGARFMDNGSNSSTLSSDCNMLVDLKNAISNSSWCVNSWTEPPLQWDDPFLQNGFLSLGASRFEAFIQTEKDVHHCTFPEGGKPCSYRSYRKQRVRAHIFCHFGYKPHGCHGACGKTGCPMRFSDSGLLTDHIRRVSAPRTTCHLCGSMVTHQNYKRHHNLVHGGSP